MSRLPEAPDWHHLRSVVGTAEFVPDAVTRMVHAANVEDASSAYWELDNRVVVQGQLFEAAACTARAVAIAICQGEASAMGLTRALDLLVEISAGEADHSELALGNAALGDVCRAELRQYLPCFRSLVTNDDEQTLLHLLDLLDLLELDREGLRELAEVFLAGRSGTALAERARTITAGIDDTSGW